MALNNKKKSLDLRLLGRLLSFTAPYKKTFVFAVVMTLVLAALAPLRPYLIQESIDNYIGNKFVVGLVMISIAQLGVLLLESGLRFWFLYRTNWLGQSVVNDIRKAVFNKIIFQNLSYFDKTPIGTLTTRTINDTEAINDTFSEGLIAIVSDILTIVAIIIVMLLTDWKLALVCLACFPLLILATYIFKESVRKSFQRVRNAVARLNAFSQEHITGMQLVQISGAEERELEKFKEINREHRNANIKGIFAYSVFFPVVEIILAASMGLLVWWGAVRLINYEVSVGVVIAFVMYLNLLFRPLRMLADKFNVLQMGMIAGERIFSVLDSNESMQENGGFVPQKIDGQIEFENVVFAYRQGKTVLKSISFTIPAGQTFAIVGQTGAGKTSIISILNRMYDISGGHIRIDGRDLYEYDIYSLRKHIGIVLQEVFLFSGTIHDNITLRDPAISRAEVENICRILGLHEFIMQLPGGYDFDVMERGNTLSHGQRQLVSFARVLLFNPSILVLDEATSSVDSESEQLIQKAIDALTQGRTSIIIAHRLSTIRKANQIIVMHQGNIAESGSHDELVARQGMYYQLLSKAEQKFILD